jgi:hypothetical protein
MTHEKWSWQDHMMIDLSTILPCSPEQAVMHVITPRLHQYATKPTLRFASVDPPQLPELWTEGAYWVSIYMLGFIPVGSQAI